MRTRRPVAIAAAVLSLLAACLMMPAPARAQATTTAERGYEVSRSQSVTPAPRGYVGRKTTDRETRTGNVPDETWGNSSEFVMTLGGWAKQCPDAQGNVPGVFEYVINSQQTISDDAGTRRTQYSHRLDARLRGKVSDDARLEYVEIEGEFTRVVDGTVTLSQQMPRRRFTPSAGGEPDWGAMRRTVEVTGELSWATAILMMGTNFKAAELEWNKLATKCIELVFDPATETRAAGPEELIEVRAMARTTGEGGAIVSRWGPWSSSVHAGGTLAQPRSSEAASVDPPTLKYTAAARPKRGHGFDIAAKTRAGVGEGKWRIIDAGYEGTFTYQDSVKTGVADETLKISGRLVWSPDEGESGPGSSKFKPTAGEFTVSLQQTSRGLEGMSTCTGSGSRTFPWSSLARGSMRFMSLEITPEGRYKLTLVIPDNPDPFPTWNLENTCRWPNVSDTSSGQVKYVSMVLGVQQGSLDAQQAIIGATSAPIRNGLREITGSWSFKRQGAR